MKPCPICYEPNTTKKSRCRTCTETIARIYGIHRDRLEPKIMSPAQQKERDRRVAILAEQAANEQPLALPPGYQVDVERSGDAGGSEQRTVRECKTVRYVG